ncbi:MAG: N-formylglutamate amidohydrolase [Stellaceae bacterium]
MTDHPLLEPDEPAPFAFENEAGGAAFFLTCDHGGRAIPRRLGRLGISEPDTFRHIAWDIGIAAVGRDLSARLDAPLIMQHYSRLVIDCNRDPAVPSSIPETSETTAIPGNRGLSAAARQARIDGVFRPYHQCIEAALDRRRERGSASVLVALHSFTPVFKGVSRPWHVGVLYNRDTRLAHRMLRLLRAESDLTVGDNEPYRVTDATDYTVPVHGERRGLPYLEIEIRQDLITAPPGQAAWAARLARLLPTAYIEFQRG